MIALEDLENDLGRVVLSRSGRDAGRYFIIVGSPKEDFVYLADGMLRKLSKPKLKKLKHIDPKPECLTGIKEKLLDGRKVFDSEVRSGLEIIGYNKK